MKMQNFKTVAEYMKNVEKEHKGVAQTLRETINKLVPKGEEAIRYGMPTVRLNGKNFLHYAVQKKHIGFYPAPSGVKAFEEELKKKGFKYSKGAIQFPLDQKLPLPLITKIVKFRLKEEKEKIRS